MKNEMKNERGQMTIEMVLITVVLVSIMVMFTKAAQSNKYAQALIEAPWGFVQGMAEDGVWKNPKDAVTLHPGTFARHHALQTAQFVSGDSPD